MLDWRRTPSQDRKKEDQKLLISKHNKFPVFLSEAFDEDLLFEKPDLAETVKISMRGTANNYFGITQVTPIASSQPIGMLVSGITSPAGEMCLQVNTYNNLIMLTGLIVF